MSKTHEKEENRNSKLSEFRESIRTNTWMSACKPPCV